VLDTQTRGSILTRPNSKTARRSSSAPSSRVPLGARGCGVGYELVNGFRPRRSPDGLRIAAGQGM